MRVVCIGVKDLLSFEGCSYLLSKAMDDIVSHKDGEVQRIEFIFEPGTEGFSIIVRQLDRAKRMTGRDIEAVHQEKIPDGFGLETLRSLLAYRIGQLAFTRGWMLVEHVPPLGNVEYGFVIIPCE